MLTFETRPEGHAAAGKRAEYRITSDRKETIDVRVTDARTGELLGAQRFAEVEEAVFDAAPIVRRHIRFAPKTYGTGFIYANDRKRHVKVTALPAGKPEEAIVAEECIYHGGEEDAAFPSLLTTMPERRLIAQGEWDEVTLVCTQQPWMTVTATGPGYEKTHAYTTYNDTVNPFRIDTAEFEGAERIVLDAGEGLKVEYAVVPQPRGARRIAWRTRAGSLEHYTFPTELTAEVEARKVRVYGPEGCRTVATAAERRMRLRSAYETREMLEELAEIVCSPEVWLVSRDGYAPADVVTEAATIHRHGILSSMEIAIRPR